MFTIDRWNIQFVMSHDIINRRTVLKSAGSIAGLGLLGGLGGTAMADNGSDSDFLDLLSIDPSSYPEIVLSATADTEVGNAGNLTEDVFSIVEDGAEQEITSFNFVSSAADIVFVFDDSGSMGGEITGLKAKLSDFIASLAEAGTDTRYGLVSFKDEVEVDQELTDSTEGIQSAVSELTAAGGGDIRENNFGALETALGLDYRDGVQKIIIDITDAPAHTADATESGSESVTDLNMDQVAQLIQESGATYFAISPDLSADYDDGDKQILAEEVGGTWYDLASADFESLLDQVVTTLTTTYVLGYATCVPPGETVSVELSVEDPDQGAASATGELAVPATFELPAECGGDTRSASVTFDDQDSDGRSVIVQQATLSDGGYLVIHGESDGAPGAVLGHSEYLEPGEHTTVQVTLDDPITSTQTLIAMAHTDDGDQEYEFPDADGPYTADGKPVTDDACITLGC